MEYDGSIDAWRADDIDDCVCPMCGAGLVLGYQICTGCHMPVNVCEFDSGADVHYLVTMENDEMGDLNVSEGTAFAVANVF